MSHSTPTIPIHSDDADEEKEESIRPMDWLFSPDFYYRRFLYVF